MLEASSFNIIPKCFRVEMSFVPWLGGGRAGMKTGAGGAEGCTGGSLGGVGFALGFPCRGLISCWMVGSIVR